MLMPYRRPLLATDLSEGSQTAARCLRFVVAPDAKGTVAHVVAAPNLPAEVATTALLEMEQRIGEAREDTQRLLAAWAARNGLPGWRAAVEYGLVGPTLARIAQEDGADLLVVGSHGAGRIERALLGSTARSALRHTTLDTLVARGEAGRMEHVLVATDFQPASRLAAARAREIAIQNGSRVTILHAIDPNVFAGALYPTPPEGRFDAAWLEKNVLEGLAAIDRELFDGRARQLAIHDRAAAGIVAKARELQPDLVVLGSHGGGALSRFLLGSVAEAVVADAPCSVLVVRA